MPMVVMQDSLLSHVNGVFNAIMVWGDGIDKTMFYGRGAGKMPTASAELGDIIDEVKSNGTVPAQTWETSSDTDFIANIDTFVAPRMFRTSTCAADVAKQAAGQVGVTVRMHTENGFLISACTERIAAKLTDALQSLGVTVYSQIPVLKDHSKFSE